MSNCVVGSDGGGTPLGVVTEHGVEGYNHLAHRGDEDDFGLFASGGGPSALLTDECPDPVGVIRSICQQHRSGLHSFE